MPLKITVAITMNETDVVDEDGIVGVKHFEISDIWKAADFIHDLDSLITVYTPSVPITRDDFADPQGPVFDGSLAATGGDPPGLPSMG